MRWLGVAALALVGIEGALLVRRQRFRRRAFAVARAAARSRGKPLLVVGNPSGGSPVSKHFPAYDCGDPAASDVCTDLTGCASGGTTCANSVPGDLAVVLRGYPDKHFGAAFVSFVLEYVPDADAALAELRRTSDELHVLTVEPFSLTEWFYPGGRWRLGSRGGRVVASHAPLR